MKKTLAALTILIVTCTFLTNAFAAPPKQGKGKGSKQDRPKACMNLTDDQVKQLDALHQKFIDDTYEMRANMMNIDQQIRMYMQTSNPDPAKLKSMVMEKADLAKDLDIKRLEFALDARKISPGLKQMGMGPGFGSPGMGYGYHGFFGKGAGFKGGNRYDCPRVMNDNRGPQNNPLPEN